MIPRRFPGANVVSTEVALAEVAVGAAAAAACVAAAGAADLCPGRIGCEHSHLSSSIRHDPCVEECTRWRVATIMASVKKNSTMYAW